MSSFETPHPSTQEVTDLLHAWGRGDTEAESRLMSAVYQELARLAQSFMSRERNDHTLEPSALVNEAYLRLIEQRDVDWQGRAQFFSLAGRMMRRVLLDHAKARGRSKRGGGVIHLRLDPELTPAGSNGSTTLISLDEALRGLAKADPRKAELIELRFFGGLSVAETACALQCSERTLAREWRLAKAWLVRELMGAGNDGG